MTSIVGFLESIEKLAYKILLWLILIPKTIVQITINPGWAPEYIKGQLKQEKSPFDEYISPIILLLIVAFIPAIAFNFLPVFGTTISSPAEKEATTDRFLMFDSETNFTSGSTNLLYTSSWYVEEITGTDESGNATYSEIFRENHNSNEWYIEYINNNTTKDAFYFEFKPGEYWVNIYVEKIDTEKNNVPVEAYYSYLWVFVPENPEEQISISNYSPNLKSKQGDKKGLENITDQLKKETSIFLALGLLIPPLLFALATKLFTSEAITENALRESFYAQCYYFSLINLAFWASYYADYFFTPDIFGYKTYDTAILIIYLPLILAIIWFIGIETQAVTRERQTKGWVAFLIVSICIIVLGVLIGLGTSFSDIKDKLRVITIWVYPIATGALLLAYAVAWYKRKKVENKKFRLGEVILILMLLIIITLVVIAFVSGETISPSILIEGTNLGADVAGEIASPETQDFPAATEPPTEAPPTDAPLPETQPFYTEEFDNPLSSDWSIFTMTDSDQAHADKVTVEAQDGKLVWNFDSVYVYYYLFNEAFRYEDVQVDVRADNRGRNNNNISLICRYDPDVGWYEFNIANNGLYDIYYAEVTSNGKIVYNSITNGGSNSIKIGKEVNEYSITCKGEQLTLFINGDEVNSVAEKNYGLREGQVGVSVSSFDVLPILIEMDWVKISEP